MLEMIFNGVVNNPPLVHNITNYVTVNDCANIVLAAGGSPLMADDIEEVADIVSISSALYINVGTLNKRTIEAMILAGKVANEKGIPVILDPVGMGASALRNNTVKTLVETIKLDVIKGNMSEIKALYMDCRNLGGVDVTEEDQIDEDGLGGTIKFAKAVANRFKSHIVITGPIDVITDGIKVAIVKNGHPMMSRITGTGCMTGSILGTYCGSNKEVIFEASVASLVLMGLSGEKAYAKVVENEEGTASFRRHLIDSVSLMSLEMLKEGAKFEIM